MKLNQSRIEIASSVLAGLDILSPDEREPVLQAIDSLENFSPQSTLPSNIQKFTPSDIPTFYLLQAPPSYRVIFEIDDQNQIKISHLFVKG